MQFKSLSKFKRINPLHLGHSILELAEFVKLILALDVVRLQHYH